MADNNISTKLEEYWKKLPNSLNGNGQNFIFLLKNMLSDLTSDLDSKFQEVSKIASAITDAPAEISEQLKNCTVTESRVGDTVYLTLKWDYSDIKNYDSAEIYVKECSKDQFPAGGWADVPTSRTVRTTKTNQYTLENINVGYMYQITFLGKNAFGSVSSKDSAPVLTYTVSDRDKAPDPPANFFVYFNKDGVLWKWGQPDGVKYAYSELRTDENVGNKVGLLEITQETQSHAQPSVREGTAYLYNKGYGKKYSTAISCKWSKPQPVSPSNVTGVDFEKGMQITYSEIPEDCTGAIVSVNGFRHYTKSKTFTYYCPNGEYKVKCCFYDIFGEGKWSDEVTVTVTKNSSTVENITTGEVTATKIGTNELDATLIDVESGTIDELTSDNIKTKTITADSGNITKLVADNITSKSISSDDIKASGAVQIVGDNVEMNNNGLLVKKDSGASIQVNENGLVFYNTVGNPYDSIGPVMIGFAKNGQYVSFKNEWDSIPNVLIFPMEIMTFSQIFPNAKMILRCFASEVSTKGFRMNCYEGITDAHGYQLVNENLINGKSAGRHTEGHPVTVNGGDGTHWDFEGTSFPIIAPYSGVCTLTINVSHEATDLGLRGGMEIWLDTYVQIIVNGEVRRTETINYPSETQYEGSRNPPHIQFDGRGGTYMSSVMHSTSITVQANVNKGDSICARTHEHGNITTKHGQGWYELYSTFESVSWGVTQEQQIDSNGTGCFIAIGSDNNNYSVS